jgi:tetratricopeptide (TPR) repeat protein
MRTAAGRFLAIVSSLTLSLVSAHPPVSSSIDRLSHSIEHDPGNAELYLRRGELYRSELRWDSAQADFTRASKIDPTRTVVDLYFGRLHLDRNRPEEALPVLDRFLERSDGDPAGFELRGRALVSLGRHSDAEKDFAAAIDKIVMAGGTPRPAVYLQWTEAANKAGLPTAEQLDRLETALVLLGRPISLELAALKIETEAKLFHAALVRIDRLLASARRREMWLARRAALLERAGRVTEARSAHLEVLETVSALPPSLRNVPAIARLQSDAVTSLERLSLALREAR